MPVTGIWLAVPFLVVLMAIIIGRLVYAWMRYRDERLITCPENLRAAGVRLNARHAAATSLLHAADLRLSACSRWPERAGCGQECLSQIEAAPNGCRVRSILTEWYAGKVCASCGRPFGDVKWNAAKPALQTADKVTVEWKQVAVAGLPETLKTALPVCFACHMAGTLVREHPELAIDRLGRTSV
jgi:hypothetical protein